MADTDFCLMCGKTIGMWDKTTLLQGLLLTSLIITLLPLPFPYYLSKTKNQPLPCLFLKKGVSSSVTCSKYLHYS